METTADQLLETERVTPIERANAALLRVITKEGIQASDDELFKDAKFGRDQAMAALDLLEVYPFIADIVISNLIDNQGVKTDRMTEEERGRIQHEVRNRRLGGQRQREIYDDLVEKYKIGQDGIYKYYGSVDATPQFIRLIGTYRETYGDEILGRTQRQGERIVTVEQSVLSATRWLSERIAASDIGLLEFCRTNPNGITNQALRDGHTSYLHENGTMANPKKPIASIEVQGLAYDALLMAAEMVGTDEEKPIWLKQAERLRDETFKRFWLPDKNYWAMALDRDNNGNIRTVATETSLPAELLETGIFENLPNGVNQKELIDPIIRKIFSSEFLTPVGIRMRGKQYANLLPYADYQGSRSVWPVNNNIISKGLSRYGLHSGARALEYLSLEGTQAVGGFLEFNLLDNDNAICWPLMKSETLDLPKLCATNSPERDHAWTISASIRMLRATDIKPDEAGWQQKLARQITHSIGKMDLNIVTKPYCIDIAEAVRLEQLVPYAN